MNYFAPLVLLLLISSCGSLQFDLNGVPSNDQKVTKIQYPNKSFWIGRSSDEVITHREFALLPLDKREGENGSKVWVFKNSGGYISSSNCSVGSYGGSCSGSGVEITCNHVFFIESKRVINYERAGACAEEQIRFRPLDKNDNPVLHREELAQLNREIASEKKLICRVTADCNAGKSCSEGKCKDLGIFGRLFSK